MPKSRRDRKITLARTEKKVGLEFKQGMVDKLRSSVDNYSRCFVFSVENMRNNHLKELRSQWDHSKFFLGKNRVMSLALGRTESDEYAENLHQISKLLRNQRGLLFTNEDKQKVVDFFEGHEAPDYARTGSKATETVRLECGPLEQFPHSIEPQLRALGMPTALKKGIVHIIADKGYEVCKEGDTLTSEQARILRLLGEQQAFFRFKMVAVWNKKDGNVELFNDHESDDNEEDEENEMVDDE